ncbi:hypothetical protein L1987_86370 [Smallanthus sonchifolius]|uniref:Uncharacterized protein n=2 Tax=Smallanthus sonchifolius TaxID=185202 RepID=A0ACB8XZL6_9ASTR|nr:hypothetical protein L1987_86367 [Smallanthus sonchifolius]KAI3676757.1 hypothetical protein L1987_86370 [Smallanthus sonchifolius]
MAMSMEDCRVDWNAIRLPPGEDCGIKSDDDDDIHEEDSLGFDAGFGNIIVVDDLPVVPKEKYEKLEGVVRKIYSQIGVIKENGLWMPVEEDTGRTRTILVRYFSPSSTFEAELAKEKTIGYTLPRAHVFSVNMFDEFDKFMEVPDEWAPPELRPYTSQVKLLDFSPGEKYLVTCSSHEPSNPGETHRVVLNIFDVRTGKVTRGFKGSADAFAIGGTGGFTGVSWPVFKWGGGKEDKYFARMGNNVISVFETETFSLIDKKSIKVENVRDFSWSPTDPIFALFVPELGGGNQPARVSLFQTPSKEELRQKNLFSVSDCKMYWQSNGEYSAVKVDRYTKTKKSTYTGFELFRIKECDIPIEVFELDNKNYKVISFAWEPKGHRFAVTHGDNTRPDVSFYSVKGGKVSKLTTLKQKQTNALFWSPGGCFIILAGLKGFNGQLEFYNVDELETMATTEHFMATYIEWDPTGRYVATSVTSVHEMENGFNFLWRPRPPSLLSPEKEEEIFKNLKKYSKKYDVQDQDISVLLSKQDCEKRKELKDEWEWWVNEWKRYHDPEKMENEAEDIEVEELLDVSEEVIQDV